MCDQVVPAHRERLALAEISLNNERLFLFLKKRPEHDRTPLITFLGKDKDEICTLFDFAQLQFLRLDTPGEGVKYDLKGHYAAFSPPCFRPVSGSATRPVVR